MGGLTLLSGLGDEQKTGLLRLLAVSATTCVVMWLMTRQPRTFPDVGAGSAEEQRRLVAILKEITRRFYHVCMDTASVAKAVRQKFEAGKAQLPDDGLREQLSRECQVFEKLSKIQTEVTEKYGCQPDDVTALQRRHAGHAEVREYEEGFRLMLNDALGGQMPVLTKVKIPETLTQDKALEILEEVQALETKNFLEKVGGTKVSMKDLGEVLTIAHRDAENAVLASHVADIGEGREVFHSALAIYTKDPAFTMRRRKIDDAHQQRMVKLIQPEKKVAP